MLSRRDASDLAKYYLSLANLDLLRGYVTMPRSTAGDTAESLKAAIQWICHAQDASNDGGVARSYSLIYNPFFRTQGWIGSYPETTGYIIPTLFQYARETGRSDLFERAVRMADWECAVQMPSGAVQGGTIGEPPSPAIFNTGQVLFGWVSAFEETGNERYLDAARRAGDFLVAAQDADGAWRKQLSRFASSQMAWYTYNTRSAWGLLLLARAARRDVYRQAAVKNVEFALGQQLPSGWFRNNCLYDPERPLLHTIAYSLRGILEIGIELDNARYIAAARTGADALLAQQREDGSLAGRFDERWQSAVQWSCLTGNAQMGTVWARLHHATGDPAYASALARANRFLQRVQWMHTGNPGLDGGISGSHPLHGRYGRFEVLNWAVKFFADSLMFEAAIARGERGDAASPRVARERRLGSA
jgi:uncharacterized protein YyaL (SSP411 family)